MGAAVITACYDIYIMDECIGHLDYANDNTIGIISKDIDEYDLENILDMDEVIDNLKEGNKIFHIVNDVGIFTFIYGNHFKNVYEALYCYGGGFISYKSGVERADNDI